MLVAGCGDSPFSPLDGREKQPPKVGAELGLVKVTISGIGTDKMSASAYSVGSRIAYNLTEPTSTTGGDGTIQIEAVSNGSFTYGVRGSGGVRYVFATFKVRNAQSDGTAYDTPRQNLTFLAVDNGSTIGETAVVELRKFNGDPITGTEATNLTEAVKPTGLAALAMGGSVTAIRPDVLQILTETEVSDVPADAGVNVFPYGFITRSPGTTPGSRTLPASPAANQYDGMVTFAVTIPLTLQANDEPFEITMLFLPMDDSETHITQSVEEQNRKSNKLLAARTVKISPVAVTILPGSFYGGKSNLICDPVRVAGSAGSPVATLFPILPGFVSLTPDPFANDGSVSNIAKTTTFTADFNAPVKGANTRSFAVWGQQSGMQFLGQAYINNGTNVVSTPPGDFLPGEIVEVSRIRGFGDCSGIVARYRVGVTGGSGTFSSSGNTYASGADPTSMALGDLNNDGDLDMIVLNRGSDSFNVYMGGSGGGFNGLPNSPIEVGSGPASLALGDLNRDGNTDVAVANEDSDNISVMLGDGSGYFREAAGSPIEGVNSPRSVALGDLDGDGDLDMVVANSSSDDISVLFGNGLGGFHSVGSFASGGNLPISVALGDLDSDGDLDMAVANYNSNSICVFLGDGAGGFSNAGSPYGTGVLPIDVSLGDLDNNGTLDIVVANSYLSSNEVSLLMGNGDGSFSAGSPITAGYGSYSVEIGDLNNDGNLDITASGSALNTDPIVALLLGDGTGNFSRTNVTLGASNRPQPLALGDLDGDGDLDITVALETSEDVLVLINQ